MPAVLDSGFRAASRGYLPGDSYSIGMTVIQQKANTTGNQERERCVGGVNHRHNYLGGQRFSSRNSSILFVSVFTSLPYSKKGG